MTSVAFSRENGRRKKDDHKNPLKSSVITFSRENAKNVKSVDVFYWG